MQINKILIFGNGQMGNFYNNYFQSQGVDSKIATNCDITKNDQVLEHIENFSPDVVINTAAKTNLEYCEDNKLDAFNVNVLGANNIANICDEKNIYFVHLSSGCIFESVDENDVKTESSTPNPKSYYSFTKTWAENLISYKKSANFKYLILRPRQPISSEVNHKNMLIKYLTYTNFIDTPNTGVIIEDLVIWTLALIKKGATGVFNVCNEGYSSPYKIALLLKKHILPELNVQLISRNEFESNIKNKRVATILDVSKLKSIIPDVRTLNDRLEDVIIQLAENIKKTDKSELQKILIETEKATILKTTPNKEFKKLFE